MKKQFVLISLLLVAYATTGLGQISVKAQAGLSYIEHFSAGITFSFSEKHNVSLLYGSDFFIRTQEFSTAMFQYDFAFTKLKFAGIIPRLGVKGGNSTYTTEYYKWKVVAIVPFIGLNYPVNKKTDILLEIGGCISLEQSAERISFGEIESYKELLPELKAGVLYTFGKL